MREDFGLKTVEVGSRTAELSTVLSYGLVIAFYKQSFVAIYGVAIVLCPCQTRGDKLTDSSSAAVWRRHVGRPYRCIPILRMIFRICLSV